MRSPKPVQQYVVATRPPSQHITLRVCEQCRALVLVDDMLGHVVWHEALQRKQPYSYPRPTDRLEQEASDGE